MVFNLGGVNNDINAGNGDNTIIAGLFGAGNVGRDVIAEEGNDLAINGGWVGRDINLGDGENTLFIGPNGYVGRNVWTGSGNDTIYNLGHVDKNIDTGAGDDLVANFGNSVMQSIRTDSGNDTIIVGGYVGENIRAGADDDLVVLVDGLNGESPNVAGIINGNNGIDTLVMDFYGGEVSEDEAEDIANYLAANQSAGTIEINGLVYTWENFEGLENLLRFAILSGATVRVSAAPPTGNPLCDGRLNCEDAAAPVAIYCIAGQVVIYDILSGGNGVQAFAIDATAVVGGASQTGGSYITSVAATGGQIVVNSAINPYDGSYNFAFDPSLCGVEADA